MAIGREKTKVAPKRRRVILGALVLFGLLLVAVWLWRQSKIAVSLTLTTDATRPTQLAKILLPAKFSLESPPVLSREIDLSPWAGQLVLLKIQGGQQLGKPSEATYAGADLRLETPQGVIPIEFYGWRKSGKAHFRRAELGSPALLADTKAPGRFVYSDRGLLWVAIPVPQQATLKIALTPLAGGQRSSAPKPYLPPYKSTQLLLPDYPAAATDRPDIFIYLIDALRADHLGCYGYARNTSPNLDAFAAENVLYENAFSTATWTPVSVASILTGLYPSTHGLIGHTRDKLGNWPLLLPEALHQAGYRTVDLLTNLSAGEDFGLAQGYDIYACSNRASADWLNSQAAKYLGSPGKTQPLFMYLHALEPHSPYLPKEENYRRFGSGLVGNYQEEIKELYSQLKKHPQFEPGFTSRQIKDFIDLYDGEIYENDQSFGAFLRLLKQAGRYDNAMIMVLADHGEAFDEHGSMEHGLNLNRETLHVPLIVKYPKGSGGGARIKNRVSLVDLYPTIMAIARVTPKLTYQLAGESLPEAPEQNSPRRIFAEVTEPDIYHLDVAGVIDEDGYKRVLDMSNEPERAVGKKAVGLWEVGKDLGEQKDLSRLLPVRAAYDEQLIAHWLVHQQQVVGRAAEKSGSVEMTDELRRGLESLGYLK